MAETSLLDSVEGTSLETQKLTSKYSAVQQQCMFYIRYSWLTLAVMVYYVTKNITQLQCLDNYTLLF